MSFTTNAEIGQFGGKLYKLSHDSAATNCKMEVNVYIPGPEPRRVPVLLYLSGLTCTPDNATEKSFLAYFAAKFGFALVFPDTSPRNTGIPGEDDEHDLGSGSGHYLNATQQPWARHYNMFSYVHEELLDKLASRFPQLDMARISLTGHSMGGGGAISGFLKNPGKYRSVSAFAPLSNPLNAPLGTKNFEAYLGRDTTLWRQYDPVYLIQEYTHEHQPDILIHQGAQDEFWAEEGTLQPENLVKAAEDSSYRGKVDLRIVEGYDHLYFFVSSFAEEHAVHHAKALGLI
ncbi:S-formylglutathione hydrol [Metschnikowia bicuspidata var. bicuspidata NRRL YB-4993]|uniref:S-formylglutathione hydrolase n=1 Tax=Metschnikowia bicuspidata var. bicuspidata NRRL YB-4993 TaxID=869754 RepID=A0A1A0HE12_9ASCO|nr:S-formylglutathione hydrol [Metschnikowia bicuspidata var. bicuspidata NRRL YB-4993]OBA22339.1 S-formylglutathione hydrol [Metschnikowia bicuspidata var. bicuspidata NRRL YB-4993]